MDAIVWGIVHQFDMSLAMEVMYELVAGDQNAESPRQSQPVTTIVDPVDNLLQYKPANHYVA